MNGLSLAIYWIGAYLINAAGMMDKITLFSNMVVFMSYAMQVVMSFMMLSIIFIMLPRASVAAKRIAEVIETKSTVRDGQKTASPEGLSGEVEFRNVSFKYPDASDYVLQNVSFQAHRGETVAFIGSTGSGKSTLINLVPRFYDATEGQVLIDGMDVRDYTQNALHNKFGYVPQTAVMFSGTVRSNVTYGDNGTEDYTQEDVENAVEVAQSKDFVENMAEWVCAFLNPGISKSPFKSICRSKAGSSSLAGPTYAIFAPSVQTSFPVTAPDSSTRPL